MKSLLNNMGHRGAPTSNDGRQMHGKPSLCAGLLAVKAHRPGSPGVA